MRCRCAQVVTEFCGPVSNPPACGHPLYKGGLSAILPFKQNRIDDVLSGTVFQPQSLLLWYEGADTTALIVHCYEGIFVPRLHDIKVQLIQICRPGAAAYEVAV